MSGSNKYWNLLHRKLSGAIDEVGQQQLDQWVDTDPNNRRMSESVGRVWEMSGSYKSNFEPNVDKAFAKFKTRISEEEKVNRPEPRKEAKVVTGSFSRTLLRIAAVVFISAGAAYLYTSYLNTSDPMMTMAAAAEGKQERVVLPDGTVVVVNENSFLEFPQAFSESERRVTLRGEAFFDVARDERKAFIIQTAYTDVKVLGTSFNVRAVESEPFTEVVVKTGKVQFQGKAAESILLTADQKGTYNHNTKQIQKTASEQLNEMAWQTKSLSFRGMPIRKVIGTLEKYFKVNIEVSSPKILDCTYNNLFPSAKLEDVLKIICETNRWQYKKTGDNKYLLKGSKCK